MSSTTCTTCKRRAGCTIQTCAMAWRLLGMPFRTISGPYLPLTDEPLVADAIGTYYAGKLIRDIAGALYFMAWRQWDDGGNFCGGLSDIAAVHVLPDGRLQVDPQQLWTAQTR